MKSQKFQTDKQTDLVRQMQAAYPVQTDKSSGHILLLSSKLQEKINHSIPCISQYGYEYRYVFINKIQV